MKLIPILVIFVLSMQIVIAQSGPPVPSPVKVFVEVNGQKLNHDGIMTNLFTKEVINIRTIDGIMLSDLSKFKLGYAPAQRGYPGDQIELKVCDVSSKCTFSFYIENTFPHEFSVIIQDPSIPKPEPILQTCSDGVSKVVDMKDCPVQPQPEPESNLLEYLIGLIIGILALFGWGKGFAKLIEYYINKAKEEEKKGNKELAQKYRERAKKMAQSVITGYLAGKYK